jgi:hypothetical protein
MTLMMRARQKEPSMKRALDEKQIWTLPQPFAKCGTQKVVVALRCSRTGKRQMQK